MRVIGGRCKGRRLVPFKGLSIRPTSDKVREAVFNILPMGFPFRTVLDIFAGTGAMGIEALSRGAGEAVFVDRDQAACSVIRRNLELCGLEGRVLKRNVGEALRHFSRAGDTFDLIFIDPPYEAGLMDEALKGIDEGGLLAPGGFIVAEGSKRAPVKAALKGLVLWDERKYGDTLIYFFRREEDRDA